LRNEGDSLLLLEMYTKLTLFDAAESVEKRQPNEAVRTRVRHHHIHEVVHSHFRSLRQKQKIKNERKFLNFVFATMLIIFIVATMLDILLVATNGDIESVDVS